jgi:hypothetical protein
MSSRGGDPHLPKSMCNDWAALLRAIREGHKAAIDVSKTAMHVWNSEEPKPNERCQCGAARWS